ncbi:MAG: hypothetical protein AAGB51_06745 [Planctomycetota bacterium]
MIRATAIVLAAGIAAPVFAQTSWNGAGDGVDWTDDANWDSGIDPNAVGTDAIIDAMASVRLATTRAVGALTIGFNNTLTILQGGNLTIGGALVNNGQLFLQALNSSGASLTLAFSGDQTISGTGEIVLNDDQQNFITASNAVITNSAGHTIRGAGNILFNSGGVVNDGSIIAQGDNELSFDPGAQGFVNNGTLRAEGAGGLEFRGGVYTNNSTIEVADGSVANVNSGAEIVGGSLTSAGTGEFRANNGSDFTGVTVTAGSQVVQGQSQNTQIRNGLTNNGTWSIEGLASSGAGTTLAFVGTQVIDGNGEIFLNDDSNNFITATDSVITNGFDHTIRGAGNLLFNSGGVINNGTILAQGANDLQIDPAADGFVNNGVLRAEGTGGLTFSGGVFTNNTSIDVADGSVLNVNSSAEIIGGLLTSSGTGEIRANNGSDFTDVTVSMSSRVVQGQSQNTQIRSGLTNNGTWAIESLASSGAGTTMAFVGDQLVDGSGEIVLNDDSNNFITSSNAILTNGASHTIRGAGNLLFNSGQLVNNGTILAQGDNELRIDPAGTGFVNNGVLRAEGAGGLTFRGGIFANNTSIDVADGSVLNTSSGTDVRGGVLSTTGSGLVRANNGTDFTGVAVAAGSRVVQAQSQNVEIRDGLTNDGSWSLESLLSSGAGTTMAFVGDQTVAGTGEIFLNDDAQNFITATNSILTNGSDHTIRGAGNLLFNSGGIVNMGRIIAEGTNTLDIDAGAQGFVNIATGVLGGTGTFTLTDRTFENDGILSPGASIGTLAWIGDITNMSSATLALEVQGPSLVDLLEITGAFTAGGVIDLSSLGDTGGLAGQTFTVLTATDGVAGEFSNAIADVSGVATGVQSNGLTFDVIYDTNEIRIANIVPAPGSVALLGLALASATRRRGRGD